MSVELLLTLTPEQLVDLKVLLLQESRRSMITGGSSAAREEERCRESFKKIYEQLPPVQLPLDL